MIALQTVLFKEVKKFFTLSYVPCHRKPERSFHCCNGKQFPVCARCTGILVGYLAIPILLFLQQDWSLWLGILLNVPMVLDGYTQLKKWRTSNNALRLITGLLSGIGQSSIVVTSTLFLVHFMLSL